MFALPQGAAEALPGLLPVFDLQAPRAMLLG
jgi:hypothetical protein